jgi:hypothetical protein
MALAQYRTNTSKEMLFPDIRLAGTAGIHQETI